MDIKTKRVERDGITWVIQYVTHGHSITFDLCEIYNEDEESKVGHGTLKWDGCLDISLDAGGRYLHFCGPEEEPFVSLVFREIYALGQEMESWDFKEVKKPVKKPARLPFIQCKSCSTVVNPEPEFMPCGGCGTAISRQTGEPFPFVLDAVMAPVVLGAQTVCKACGGPERHRPWCQRDFVPCDHCLCSHEPPACIIPLSPDES